jgi:hypothetical protein
LRQGIEEVLTHSGRAYVSIELDALGRMMAIADTHFLDLSEQLAEARAMGGVLFGDQEDKDGSRVH